MLFGKPPSGFEAFNDYDRNLINFYNVTRERTMALLRELHFVRLNSREDFKVLVRLIETDAFPDRFVIDEDNLTKVMLPEISADELIELRHRFTQDYDARRAAMYFKKIRGSFDSMGKSFAAQPFDVLKYKNTLTAAADRLSMVVIENLSYDVFITRYDQPDSFFYCDPPYLETEHMYDAEFSLKDHIRLRELFGTIQGRMLVSYNDCAEIRELYDGWYMFDFRRVHSMAQKSKPGAEFPELLIANYDFFERIRNRPNQLTLFDDYSDGELSDSRLYSILKEGTTRGGSHSR